MPLEILTETNLEALFVSAVCGLLAFVAFFSLSAALRRNRPTERWRGRAERIGYGIFGLLVVLTILLIVLVTMAT